MKMYYKFDKLVQDCGISIGGALEISVLHYGIESFFEIRVDIKTSNLGEYTYLGSK